MSRFNFVPPPEAPVFRPTEEEFKDPLSYLLKIRSIGTKTGICKIIPPESWNPPFAVNMKEFTFTPRVQRLYELEAQSRIKLNFLSRLYKYVRSQGGDKIRVPSVGGRFLDLHALHKAVKDHGGYDKVCKDHTWCSVAERLSYPGRYTLAIKNNYEKLLLAFDRLVSSYENQKPKRSPSKRLRNSTTSDTVNLDLTANKELRNLRFFGPGPKAAVPGAEFSKIRKADIESYTCRTCNNGDDEPNLLVCDNENCQACYHIYCLTPPLQAVPNYHWKCPECIRALCMQPTDPYGFPQSNRTYSLHEFGIMADEFKAKYFGRPCCDVPCSVVEQEFWRIVQEYNDDVVVEYGADIHSSKQGSGFPTEDRLKNLVGTAQQLEDAKRYATDPWNLNILPLLDRSVLRFIKGNIDGMKIPWCYVGMVFSSFCWHIEDHWSYSINFNHWGEPKTWYGVSRLHAEEFERAMRKHAPDLFEQAPDLLHHITTNMNPNILQAEGVPIYRTDQYCGEFVVTFPRAYHAGFNQGFNFAEAVNICPPDWIPIGRACIDHYALMKRHCVFSNEELLCTLAEVACGRAPPEDILLITTPYTSSENSAKLNGKPRLPPGCSTAGLDISATAVVHQEFSLLLARERRLRRIALNVGVVLMERVRFDQLPDDVRVCDVCLTTLFLSGISCPCSSMVQTPKKSSPCQEKSSPQPGEKRHLADENDCERSQAADNSYEEKERTRRFMVCLQHFDQLCPKCEPSACTLKYHHSIEELEELERALASRSNVFYAWKEPLLRLIENSKKKQDSPALASSEDPAEQFIMTLSDLKHHLEIGDAAGYQVDDTFAQAQALCERASQLMSVCSAVKSALTTCKGEEDKKNHQPRTNSSPVSCVVTVPNPHHILAEFKPFVSVNHEFDLNKIRESDLTHLLEACKQQYPINVMLEPDVWYIQDLVNFVNSWRQSAREAVAAACRVTLNTATRSLTTQSTSSLSSPLLVDVSSSVSMNTSDKASNDEKALSLLSKVVDSMREKCQNFASELLEWISLNSLCESIKWLCSYQRHTDEPNPLPWTYPRLRQHLSEGEKLLLPLNSLCGLAPKSPGKVSVVHTGPMSAKLSPFLIEIGSAPLPRLIRARMRTAVGQLTQSVVQVDSSIVSLVELLSLPGPFSCAEVLIALGQIQSLRLDHLSYWDSPASDTKHNSNGTNDPKSDNGEQCPLPETLSQISDRVSSLNSLLLERIRSLLKSNAEATSVASRPQLVEAEVLLALGVLLDQIPDGSSNFSDSEDTLGAHLGKLHAIVMATRMASSRLWEAFLPSHGDNRSDSAPLVKFLLPKFLSESENENCFYEFMDSYSKNPSEAIRTFETQTLKSRKFLEDSLATSTSIPCCSVCAERLALPPIPENSSTECPFCPLLSVQSTRLQQESFSQLQNVLAFDSDQSEPAPLCTPQSVAFFAFTKQIDAWQMELAELLKANKTLLGKCCNKQDVVEPTGLCGPLQSAVDAIISLETLSNESDDDCCPSGLNHQLRALFLVGCTFPVEFSKLTFFLQQLLNALR